jgi:hypothetical protein
MEPIQEQQALLEAALLPFVADVRRTLDPHFRVEVVFDDYEWWWAVEDVTGAVCRATIQAVYWDPDEHPREDAVRLTAALAQEIPDFAFDHVLEPWPRCPRHRGHPLYPQVRASKAAWVCRRDNIIIASIGELPA